MTRIQRVLGRPQRRYAAAMPVFTAAILTLTVVTAMAALQLKSSAKPDGDNRGSESSKVAPPTASEDPLPLQLGYSLWKTVEKPLLMAQAQQLSQSSPPANQSPDQTIQPDKTLFDRAIQQLENGNYIATRLTLNTLINNYPASDYVVRAKQALADSWLREGGPNGVSRAEEILRELALQATATRLPSLTAEQQKAREDVLKRELMTPYKKWMNEDVAYIISDEERKAFTQLNTDDERGKFVEQFWLRRDPTPGTEENEFKQEIYRRIAYTNEHFGDSTGVAGWRTDRGRIYIQYGPPDEIEAHSSGGTYERPAAQGGGATETFPFEQWLYRHIDGVGQNIIMEFVDKSGNGEYKMTMDPSEKDALLNRAAAIRENFRSVNGLPAISRETGQPVTK